MKYLIASATALTLLASSAYAQNAAPTPPPAPTQAAPAPMPPAPPEELAPGADAQNGSQNSQSSNGMDDEMDGMGSDDGKPDAMKNEARRGPGRHHWDRDRPGRHHWRGGPRHARGNEGARFRLNTKDDGSVELDVRCAANEPMQACADIVNGMLDRLSNDDMSSEDRNDQ
ncbi:hypothetical protein JYU29_04375 [Tianweitania sp. BSSL-BM11]|uniref:Uncharacterized protein n=1 Tax=Tianweitania aestuarii TaxID=2814886 RepID=A0ABS5RW52_9HYPH|nr:hypothetical protein [Tianweitania aestuarii]MBS9719922.1 hypothetical protein [Tianweitania aestuarii]